MLLVTLIGLAGCGGSGSLSESSATSVGSTVSSTAAPDASPHTTVNGANPPPGETVTTTPSTDTTEGQQVALATYRFDRDEPWPGALIEGRLEIRSGCLVLTADGVSYPVMVPAEMTVDPVGHRLVMQGAADLPLDVEVVFGGGETKQGAFEQPGVTDPHHCLNTSTVILLEPSLD